MSVIQKKKMNNRNRQIHLFKVCPLRIFFVAVTVFSLTLGNCYEYSYVSIVKKKYILLPIVKTRKERDELAQCYAEKKSKEEK